ncbi:MAG: LysR family transcriptional regulator [Clostridia bacterium]|nr:LysR family transcriptional regulator [Clostridia bacterium]
MELRELKYFIAVANEGSISKAAESLYITQPSLSRQMQNLEREIGKQLFIRGNKKITLTEAGELLKKRAEEMLALYDKTQAEISAPTESVYGEVYIGGGESYAITVVAQAAKKLLETCQGVRFNFFSGDTIDVCEKLDKGLIDFAVLVEPADLSKYEYLRLPQKDTWGVLMRKDSALAQKEFVTPQDLHGLPLIRSKHAINSNELSDWFGGEDYNIVATYNLLYNASLLVKEGIGYAVGLDGIINTTGDSELTFRPLKPALETTLAVAWKKRQVFSKAAEKFLDVLSSLVSQKN